MSRRHAFFTIVCAGLLGLGGGCRPTVVALGTSPGGAVNGADIMEAVRVHLTREGTGDAFGPYQQRLTREVLAPSGLFKDRAWWTTSSADGERVLHFAGATHGTAQYEMAPHIVSPPLQGIGESRYAFGLRRRSADEFEWNTLDEYQVGHVTVSQVADAMHETFESPAHPRRTTLLQDLHGDFPRAREAFGRMFTMTAAGGQALPDGSTRGQLALRVEAERARKSGYPFLAGYLDRYITPLHLDGALVDLQGRTLVTLTVADNIISMNWRVHGGKFVPLEGPLVPPPDRWRIRFSIREEVLLWDVGANDVFADVELVDTDTELGWLLRFNRDPDWNIPLPIRRMFGGSLARPFQDGGITLRMVMRQEGDRTLASRRIHAVLRENMLIRWMGKLVATIGEDFVERTQAEGYRFFREGSEAYQRDIDALGRNLR